MILLAQSGDLFGPYTGTITAVVQLGLAVFLTIYLIVKSGPAERKAADDRLLRALKEQRDDHEKWRQSEREATTQLVTIIGEVHGEVVKEIKALLSDQKDKVEETVKRIDDGFNKVMEKLQNLRFPRGGSNAN